MARLVDMDAEGIDVAVLYPTAMLTWIEETEIFGAACRAYNNWLHDYCSAAPTACTRSRSSRCKTPSWRRPRCGAPSSELGAKAVMIRPARYIGERKLNDPAYDPFWAAAADLDCPIGVHPSPHGDMPNSCRLLGLADGVINPTEGLALRQGLTNAFDLQMAVAYFVLGGICERHPIAAGRVPRGHRRVDRADAAALRPPVRDLRQLRPVDAAERGVRRASA